MIWLKNNIALSLFLLLMTSSTYPMMRVAVAPRATFATRHRTLVPLHRFNQQRLRPAFARSIRTFPYQDTYQETRSLAEIAQVERRAKETGAPGHKSL